MKQTKNFWRKLLSLITGLALIFQTIYPLFGSYQFLVRAEDESTPVAIEAVAETATPEAALTFPESTESARPTESTSSVQSILTPVSDWQSIGDSTDQTAGPVVLNREYRFRETPVTVVFTKLPENPGTLTIAQIKLSPERQKELQAFSDTAYDITSTMSNGNFTYNLTLSLPPQARGQNFQVKSTENTDLTNLAEVEEEKTVRDDTVTVKDLNHFTVFVLVNDVDTDNPDSLGDNDDVASGTLSPIEDSFVDQNGPTGTHGTSVDINVKSYLNNNQRGFIKFDLTSIPSASTVSKATLRLYLNNAPGSSRTYNLQRISGSWTESSLTWNTQPAVSGAVAASVDTGTTNNVWLEWDVTGEVQAFLGGTTNFGWRLADSTEDNGSSLQGQFNSGNSGTELRRPQLVLDYAASTQANFYNSPSAQAAVSGGDGNGFETTSTGAFTDGGTVATDVNTSGSVPNDRHLFYDYDFTVPTGASVGGIEVRADWYLDDTGANNSLSVELSWDGGISWTTAKTDITETDKEHIVSLGGASELWGRSWMTTDFSNTNFRVRVTANSDGSGSAGRDFYLDWIPVRVYYTADSTPPDISFTNDVAAGPVFSDTISLSVTDANPDTGSYAYGFSSDAVCNVSDTYGTAFTSGESFTLSTEANNGKYLCAKASDLAGNTSYKRGTNVLNIDRTAPTPTITGGPSGTVNSSSATFTFSADEFVNFGCRINLEAFEICVFGGTTGSKTYSGLTDGAYTFTVEAIDSVGNFDYFKNAAQSWTVDTVVPTVTIVNPNTDSAQSKTITASASEGTLTMSNTTGSVCNGTLSFVSYADQTFSSEANNGTRVCYRAIDGAGNTTYSLSNAISGIDTTAPTTPIASPGAGDYFADQSITLASSDSGAGLAGIYYTLDGSAPSSTSGTLYAGAIAISTDKTLKAIAYDNIGNGSSVLTAAYGIAPVISSQSATSVSATSATITWTTDDPSTSRVIYDTVSHPVLGAASNYDYANSTIEDATLVTSHSVNLTGLSSGTTYYYRTVSHGSPEAVGSEGSFTTGSVAGASSGDSGGGGGGGGAVAAPVCGDTKPGSAPTLTSAVAGLNSVTLFWAAAANPVTYYLVTYGGAPGAQTYGNPNVGGSGTTSYTVSGLSGGLTYYFRVRAGNGCTPGDYSNELAAAPFGGFVSGPAAGFAPGVLGTTENLSTGAATEAATLGTQSGEGRDWYWVILVLALGASGYWLWRHFH